MGMSEEVGFLQTVWMAEEAFRGGEKYVEEIGFDVFHAQRVEWTGYKEM